jgi:hypothetical protein
MEEQGRASPVQVLCGFQVREEPLHILQRLHQRDEKHDKKRKMLWLHKWIPITSPLTHNSLQQRERVDESALSTLMCAPANTKQATPLLPLAAGETLHSEGQMTEEASGIGKAADQPLEVFSVGVSEVKTT